MPNAATPRPESGYKGEAAVALAVDDVEATLAELRSQGVSIAVEKQNSGVCYFAVITDPDGNRLWLHQRY